MPHIGPAGPQGVDLVEEQHARPPAAGAPAVPGAPATGPGSIYKVLNKPDDVARSVSQLLLGVRIECAECHHIDKKNRATQALFICRNCGVVAHADRNASHNIAQRGAVV